MADNDLIASRVTEPADAIYGSQIGAQNLDLPGRNALMVRHKNLALSLKPSIISSKPPLSVKPSLIVAQTEANVQLAQLQKAKINNKNTNTDFVKSLLRGHRL